VNRDPGRYAMKRAPVEFPGALPLLLALLLLVGSSAAAADPQNPFRLKPGARGAVCVDCHGDIAEQLEDRFVHTPVKAGNCADCHNPHASDHGRLLEDEPDRICATCHDDIVPADADSVHRVVADGQCVDCHDPHASNQRANLVQPEAELCATCHGELVEAARSARFGHPPVAEGCLTCHDPHASSGSSRLLATAVPALCTDCHDPRAASFSGQHMGYPVERADCTSCHNPHGSAVAGLLWDNVHPPVESKMCAQCHMDASSPQALELKRPGFETCRGCHDDLVDATFASNRIHGPLLDRQSCLNCHNPHASRESALLKAPQKQVCGNCHGDTLARLDRSLVKHAPIEAGECSTCHQPHAAEGTFLLVDSDVIALCGTCHDWQRHSTHPIGPETTDPRNPSLNVDCLSCHRSHGSPFKAFANYDPKADLCVECHEQFRR